MTVGDVMTDIDIDIATTANMEFQPTAGDAWLIFAIGSSVENGTTHQPLCKVGMVTTSNELATCVWDGHTIAIPKFIVDNTNWLAITNSHGSAQNLGFSAIKIVEA